MRVKWYDTVTQFVVDEGIYLNGALVYRSTIVEKAR